MKSTPGYINRQKEDTVQYVGCITVWIKENGTICIYMLHMYGYEV